MRNKINNQAATILILRVGLAFVFVYAAVASLRQPLVWAAYLPNFLVRHISETLLIKIFAVYELALALWLLSGKYAKYAGLLCALTLVGIVLSNLGQLTTIFRDVGLCLMAVALFFAAKQRTSSRR